MPRTTAAVLLVGNELLSGKVADENTHFLARELFSRGIELRRVLVVPDELEEIVEALHDLLERVDYVFSCGGIGPTHDDITVEAVARALDRPLELDGGLEERARRLFGQELEPAHRKMATVPRGSTLVESPEIRWPALVVDRVFVLAGVPKIMRRAFRAVCRLLPLASPQKVATVYVLTDEWSLTPALQATVDAFPEVLLGSYPVLDEPEYRVRLTLEGDEEAKVLDALAFLIDRIPAAELVRTETPSTAPRTPAT